MIYQFRYEEKPPLLERHLNLGGENTRTKIDVNSHYFVRDGKCWVPVMGEYHYCRSDVRDWKRELLKMKAGGIQIVSTYVIWIYHEEEEGVFDFTGNKDLHAFVKTVRDAGLEILLRIGPWIHGEVRNGGFPDWLLGKGCSLREDDERYLGYVKRFYRQIYEQVKDDLFEEDGPIVGIQIENELPDNGKHLLTLKNIARETGLTVPIFTVTGWNAKYGAEIPEYEVIPVFGGYPEAPWEQHIRELPPSSHYFFLESRNDSEIGKDLMKQEGINDADVFHMRYELYPFITCELGGGIQVTHHRRPVISGDDVAALALVKLGSGNNLPGYYMYHGGTNGVGKYSSLQESRATGYPNDLPVKNYDFQAPIGESGILRDQYRKLKLQHLFLHHFGSLLGKMISYFQKPAPSDLFDSSSLRYCIRTDGHSGFVFVNNYRRLHPLPEKRNVQFEVIVDGKMQVFPKKGITVPSNAYFLFPYGLNLGGAILEYATAQLLAVDRNIEGDFTWFFFAIEGIYPEYVIDGRIYDVDEPGQQSVFQIVLQNACKITIVTLTEEQAEHFYVEKGQYYLTGGDIYFENIFEEKGGQSTQTVVYRVGNTDLSFERWGNGQFVKYCMTAQQSFPAVKIIPLDEPLYPQEEDYGEEELSGEGRRARYELCVDTDWNSTVQDIYLFISYIGDLAQIYVDGMLTADDFNKGVPWIVSWLALKRAGKRIELSLTENTGQNVYRERKTSQGLQLCSLQAVPVYQMGVSLEVSVHTGLFHEE